MKQHFTHSYLRSPTDGLTLLGNRPHLLPAADQHHYPSFNYACRQHHTTEIVGSLAVCMMCRKSILHVGSKVCRVQRMQIASTKKFKHNC